MKLEIQNSTAVFKLLSKHHRFTDEEFMQLARNGINTEYNPARFHAIIMRIRHRVQDKTTAALIFKSSKVVLTGIPHPDLAEWIARKVLRRCRSALGQASRRSIHIWRLTVNNVVGSYRHRCRLSLDQMYQEFRRPTYREVVVTCKTHTNNIQVKKITYEPCTFPALRLKLRSTGASCLVYITGRVIVTGVRNIQQLEATEHILMPMLERFPMRRFTMSSQ